MFLCSRGCPGAHSGDQASLQLRDILVSASRVLGVKLYSVADITTTTQLKIFYKHLLLCVCVGLSIWVSEKNLGELFSCTLWVLKTGLISPAEAGSNLLLYPLSHLILLLCYNTIIEPLGGKC